MWQSIALRELFYRLFEGRYLSRNISHGDQFKVGLIKNAIVIMKN